MQIRVHWPLWILRSSQSKMTTHSASSTSTSQKTITSKLTDSHCATGLSPASSSSCHKRPDAVACSDLSIITSRERQPGETNRVNLTKNQGSLTFTPAKMQSTPPTSPFFSSQANPAVNKTETEQLNLPLSHSSKTRKMKLTSCWWVRSARPSWKTRSCRSNWAKTSL